MNRKMVSTNWKKKLKVLKLVKGVRNKLKELKLVKGERNKLKVLKLVKGVRDLDKDK